MRGAVIGAFYQPPLIRPASSSSNCPKPFKRKRAPAEADAVAMGNPSALQRETRVPKRRLIPPGAVPIAAAARRAPAPIRTADPGPPPWATRARSATGNFFNRGVIRAPAPEWSPTRQKRTNKPPQARRTSPAPTLSFASNPSVVCGEAMIAVSRHDKKRRTVCRMRKTKGLWPVHFATSRLGIDAPSL